jgi:putative ABC transport system permease protein
MRTLFQDFRYGARIVASQPGYSILIVVTLALAIGANAVIFSFTNVLVLRPLPMKDQDTLGWVFTIDPQRGGHRGSSSLPDYLDFRHSLRSFQDLAATGNAPLTLTMTGRGDATRLSANRVTANLMDIWGLKTIAGRGFAAGEDAPGAARTVVLSHQFWARQFGSDPALVGQALMLNGEPYTVVGVLAPDIEIGNISLIDIWVPLTLDLAAPRDRREFRMIGRLARGVTLSQADAEIREASRRLEQDYPATNKGWTSRVASTKESITGPDTWVVLALLMLVVGFILLIACANVANLVLARATGRRRELAVRVALGASRGRVIRQLLTESLALGALGGLLGLAFAQAGLRIVRAAAYEPFFQLVVIDRNVLVFTAMLALATPILFSLLPALQSSKADLNATLKDSSPLAGGDLRGRRSRSVLVVSQLALAMALLIVSGLLVKSMIVMTRTPLGFDPENVLTLQLDLPEWRYKTDAAVSEYYERLLFRVAAMPGVRNAAAVERLPVLGGERIINVKIDGLAESRQDERPWAVHVTASDTFFATAGIPTLAGRVFTPQDSAGRQSVAVVSQSMATRYWGSAERALGGRVGLTDGADAVRWLQVVGVTGDVKRPDLTGTNPQIYLPARQKPVRAMALMVRASNPDSLTAALRGEVRAADPDVPVYQMRTMGEAFDDELSSSRILLGLFAAFAILALVLAASGLYGVIAYSVSRRVQEIGIRMALGAVAGDIRGLIMRQTLTHVVIGTLIGLAGGAAIARAASSILFNVSPSDPATYAGVVVVLAAVAGLAAYVPIRRATRIDPLLALRGDT